eukprot:168039-Ditylum_brightwellii.AAC.1
MKLKYLIGIKLSFGGTGARRWGPGSGARTHQLRVGLAKYEEIYIAASRRMEKHPQMRFWEERVLGLGSLHTYSLFFTYVQT